MLLAINKYKIGCGNLIITEFLKKVNNFRIK